MNDLGPYWRELEKGEVLRPFDEYQDARTGLWYFTKCPGCPVGVPRKTSARYKRRTDVPLPLPQPEGRAE